MNGSNDILWKVTQQNFYKVIGLLKANEEMTHNLTNGGECLIFDIIDELKVVFKDDREMCERCLTNIWPD